MTVSASGFEWDRRALCQSQEELELHEAALALRRVIDAVPLNRDARRTLQAALAVLEARGR